MSVFASFVSGRVATAPGQTAVLTLLLQNTGDDERTVKLRPAGDLAAQTMLQAETISLDPHESFEMPIVIDAASTLVAGPHRCVIEVADGGANHSADATVDIQESSGFAADLQPPRSRSGSAGRHRISVANTGNVPILVDIRAAGDDDATSIELAATTVSVEPGRESRVELRVTPHHRFWSGSRVDHEFAVELAGSNGERIELGGVYDQGPRVPAWLGPALAGAAIALLLGTLAWFLLLRPAVEDIADERAELANQADREALEAKITELEVAAAEAEELPLGQPTDLRLAVAPAEGDAQTATFPFDPSGGDRVLSITDAIFQNPSGATGRVELVRGTGDASEVLLESELANFRDLDFHLVAPFRVEAGGSIGLRVECVAAGPTANDVCDVSVTVLGFVDG
jgi:hypothetical protein